MRIPRQSIAVVLFTILFTGLPTLNGVQASQGAVTGTKWLTSWWSWVYWWEANRGAVLSGSFLKARGDATLAGAHRLTHNEHRYLAPAPSPGDDTDRYPFPIPITDADKVAKKLLATATDPTQSVEARIQALLTASRLKTDETVKNMTALTKDQNPQVAHAAWLMLGLMNGEQVRKAMGQEASNIKAKLTLAQIIALGLTDQLDPSAEKQLLFAVNRGGTDVIQASALWALRRQDVSFLTPLAHEVLNESANPRLAMEAILALGRHPESADEKLETKLQKIYYGTNENVTPATLAAWRRYTARTGSSATPVEAMRTAAAIAFAQFQFPEDNRIGQMVRRTLRRPYEQVKGFGDGRSRQWRQDGSWDSSCPFRPLGAQGKLDGGYELRWGSIALGAVGYEEDAEVLIRILRGENMPYRHVSKAAPGRAFAALALGLYLRRMGDGAKHIDDSGTRDEVRRVPRVLARYAADGSEPANLRAACVLALGLSKDAGQVQAIHDALLARSGNDPMIRGFGVLALGMLGDDLAVKVARQLLPKPEEGPLDAARIRQRWGEGQSPWDIRSVHGVKTLLAVRATMRGLGLLNTPEALDLIKGTFGRETYSSLAAAWALRRCGNTDLIKPLKELINDHGKPALAQMATMALGKLLTPEQPSRLRKRLVQQSCIVWPVGRGSLKERTKQVPTYAYRRLAAPFLYEVMIPLTHDHAERY